MTTVMDPFPLESQIACVKREIHKRESFYPRWVGEGKMSQKQADREVNLMRAVLATLERQQRPADLFGQTEKQA